MDLDASIKSHSGRLAEIESFVEGLKAMMTGASDHVDHASETVDDLLAFKAQVQGMLPMLEKTAGDVSLVVADLSALKEQLGPALEWIAEQQKTATLESQNHVSGNIHAGEKPSDIPDTDKPLEHLAEVESDLAKDDAPPADVAVHAETDQHAD